MTTDISTPAQLGFVAPLLIVREVLSSVRFYTEGLGFTLSALGPEGDPYWAMLERDGAHLMLKTITEEVQPLPNPSRHPWARWDAYVYTSDPDALAEEFTSRGVPFRAPVGDNPDRLRGFEVADADGYVLYFGRPVQPPPAAHRR